MAFIYTQTSILALIKNSILIVWHVNKVMDKQKLLAVFSGSPLDTNELWSSESAQP